MHRSIRSVTATDLEDRSKRNPSGASRTQLPEVSREGTSNGNARSQDTSNAPHANLAFSV